MRVALSFCFLPMGRSILVLFCIRCSMRSSQNFLRAARAKKVKSKFSPRCARQVAKREQVIHLSVTLNCSPRHPRQARKTKTFSALRAPNSEQRKRVTRRTAAQIFLLAARGGRAKPKFSPRCARQLAEETGDPVQRCAARARYQRKRVTQPSVAQIFLRAARGRRAQPKFSPRCARQVARRENE